MSSRDKKGLIKVLLSEEDKNPVLGYSFFENYFNEDCKAYINYLDRNKVFDSFQKLIEYAFNIGCEGSMLRIMFEEHYEELYNEIRDGLRYDYDVNDNTITLDRGDLMDLLDNKYLADILDETGEIFTDYWDVDIEEVKGIMNDRELEMLEKNPELEDDILNVYMWAYNQTGDEEAYEEIVDGLKSFFSTDDVKFEMAKNGKRFFVLHGEKFLHNVIHDWFTNVEDDYLDELYECGSVSCILQLMIGELNGYEKISTKVGGNYYYPDSKKLEDNFHDSFEANIG
jgi:hypothetical protein